MNRLKTGIAKMRIQGKVFNVQILEKALSKLPVDQALKMLSVCRSKKYAKLLQCILSQAANNSGLGSEKLRIVEISAGRAPSYKRIEFKGRGRTGAQDVSFTNVRCLVQGAE